MPEITIAYGMTEASPGITMTPRDCVGRAAIADRRPGAAGARGEDRRSRRPASSARPGERGELCCRGYNVMKGYYNNPDATRAAIDADGWLHTGDEASMDRRRLLPDHRPDQGPDHPRRREHRAEGDRGSAARASGGRRRVRVRRAGCVFRRSGGRGGPAEAGRRARRERRRTLIALVREPRWRSSRCRATCRFVPEFPMTASGKIQKYKLRDAPPDSFSI